MITSGLGETRLNGAKANILKSNHLLYQHNKKKYIKHLVTKMEAISEHDIYIVQELNKIYSLQLIQVYVTTNKFKQSEQFYEDIANTSILC